MSTSASPTGHDPNEAGDAEPRRERPPVVTIAARFGAGGSVVGPRVAQQLGVLFLDRVINARVADRAGVSEEVVTAYTEQPRAGLRGLLASLSRLASPLDAAEDRPIGDEGTLRKEVELFMAEASVSGGVIIGRGANFVLRGLPGVLTVLLTGPREARVEQAMRLHQLDRATAERETDRNDEARLGYVRRNYGAEREDPADYHLIIDSTALDLDTVVDLIVRASDARRREALSAGSPSDEAGVPRHR